MQSCSTNAMKLIKNECVECCSKEERRLTANKHFESFMATDMVLWYAVLDTQWGIEPHQSANESIRVNKSRGLHFHLF